MLSYSSEKFIYYTLWQCLLWFPFQFGIFGCMCMQRICGTSTSRLVLVPCHWSRVWIAWSFITGLLKIHLQNCVFCSYWFSCLFSGVVLWRGVKFVCKEVDLGSKVGLPRQVSAVLVTFPLEELSHRLSCMQNYSVTLQKIYHTSSYVQQQDTGTSRTSWISVGVFRVPWSFLELQRSFHNLLKYFERHIKQP